MAIVSAKAKEKRLRELFPGDDIRVSGRKGLAINNFIEAEWLEIQLPEVVQRDDLGVLSLYPVDDHQFCLELLYAQYAEDAVDATVYSLRFLPAFFDQYPAETLMANRPFRFDQVSNHQFSICVKSRMLLEQLQLIPEQTPFITALRRSELAMSLLRCALECITIPSIECQVPACRFLAYESEREKIQEARLYLEAHLDRPTTIKELSRKVAMNECYLKKGFKALVGKTIHEYQQELRITKAKELLQQQGYSVTNVANVLGFSSISHFSTAFKRITGMKPCELLA